MCKHTIEPLKTNTKFVILMHPKEFKKTKNGTGHLTNNSLENCELHIGIDFTHNDRINSTWPCSKKILRLSKNLSALRKVSFVHNKSSQFMIKTQPNVHCLSTIESTLCVLEQLNTQNIENIDQLSLDNFLEPFKKMVAYQISCASVDGKFIRFKKKSYQK